MQVRSYTQKEVNEIVRRYSTGDEAASAEVDRLAKGYQHDTGATYRDALRAVLKAPGPKPSQWETDPGKVHNAGAELSKVASNIQRDGVVVFRAGNVHVGRVNYAEALRLAVASNPTLGATYIGRETMPDAEAYASVKKSYAHRS